jgi:hypothetical protein
VSSNFDDPAASWAEWDFSLSIHHFEVLPLPPRCSALPLRLRVLRQPQRPAAAPRARQRSLHARLGIRPRTHACTHRRMQLPRPRLRARARTRDG